MFSIMQYHAALFLLITILLIMRVSGIGRASPSEVHMDPVELEKILEKLEDQVDSNQLPGAAFEVYRAGKLVYQGAVGFQDKELLRPMNHNTIVRLLSQTKPITAVGIMILVEQGRVNFHDPLWKYHHGFKNMEVRKGPSGATVPALRDITILDLLCHTSGLGYSAGFNDPLASLTPLEMMQLPFRSLESFMDELAEKPLLSQPGETWRYSWSYDVLGYVIQQVTRQSPNIFLRQQLFIPLKMLDTDFYVPAAKLTRFAVAYTMTGIGPLMPVLRPEVDPIMALRPPPFISCGSGLVSTVTDYSRFALMLLNGGELDGVKILNFESVDLMWRNQVAPELLPLHLNGWTSDSNTGWGLGFTITASSDIKKVDWESHQGSSRTGTISWGGAAMTSWMASADLDVVISFATQRIASPIPDTFQKVVVQGVIKSIRGNSTRKLPGNEAVVEHSGYDVQIMADSGALEKINDANPQQSPSSRSSTDKTDLGHHHFLRSN